MFENLLRAATCRIICGELVGTGWLIAADTILTARHCILPALNENLAIEAEFVGPDGATFAATVIDDVEDLDACLLALAKPCGRTPLSVNEEAPREGTRWFSFGYPAIKDLIGHRLVGTISHVLPSAIAKMDIDLAIDPDVTMQEYQGLSGAAVADDEAVRAMIRLGLDGTVGAISIGALSSFLTRHGIDPVSDRAADETRDVVGKPRVAGRTEFQRAFELHLLARPGAYLFLQGAHGIGKTTFCGTFTPRDSSISVLGTYAVVPPYGETDEENSYGSDAYVRALPEVFFEWLDTTISEILMGTPPRQENRSYVQLVQQTERLLRTYSEHCHLRSQHGLLFIDGIDAIWEFEPTSLKRFLGLLPAELPLNISVVLTAPNHATLATALGRHGTAGDVLTLPGLPADACERYCWQELDPGRVDAEFVGRLCDRSQGHPLYLRYLIRYANGHPEDQDLDEFPVLDGPIEDYYESIWARLLLDANAPNLIALIARLRPSLDWTALSKVLTESERMVLLPTKNRIGHLLRDHDTPEIHHPSFAAFVAAKTADADTDIQVRLGKFCLQEGEAVPYCRKNVVHHLLRADDIHRRDGVFACDQDWVDACVTLGVRPDMLLADLRTALNAAPLVAPPVETFRLLLLIQRVGFRYDTLFAQSAYLMARAFVALGRPADAVAHIVRYGTLIADADAVLRIAHAMIDSEYLDQAADLLLLLRRRCVAVYSNHDVPISAFIEACETDIHCCFALRYAGWETFAEEAVKTRDWARHILEETLKDKPRDLLLLALARFESAAVLHMLCFIGTFPETGMFAGSKKPPRMALFLLANVLLEYEEFVDAYDLPRASESLKGLFVDVRRALENDGAREVLASLDIVDALSRLGAPSDVVDHVIHMCVDASADDTGRSSKDGRPEHTSLPFGLPPAGDLRAVNGVDVDFDYARRNAMYWRTVGLLDSARPFPFVRAIHKADWLGALAQVLRAIAFAEGRARRAIVDGDEALRKEACHYVMREVLPALRFSLAERAEWSEGYAIPEALLPFLYECITELLEACFPEEVDAFVRDVTERSGEQLGLYSEGFRTVLRTLARILTCHMEEADAPERAGMVFGLIGQWRDHVLSGVENRHELVPELLRLIVAFSRVGAHEEADRLYKHMLSVSMGPSWYKEAQFGLMTRTLRYAPPDEPIGGILAAIAGHLERASGEMTFQRYVRYEKSEFLGLLCAKGRYAHACAYFRRQTCGSTAQLVSEWESGGFDAPTPRRGGRFPGGALEEQGAILEMVRHSEMVPWRLRWALLEVFHHGDERHLIDYAAEYAQIINESGSETTLLDDFVHQSRLLLFCETAPSNQRAFAAAFYEHLAPALRPAFSFLMPEPDAFEEPNPYGSHMGGDDCPASPEPIGPADTTQSDDPDTREGSPGELFMPGLFGHTSAMNEADGQLQAAERQLRLGNRRGARRDLVSLLSGLQAAGWDIWSQPSKSAMRSNELLVDLSEGAPDLLQAYAPLINDERLAPSWRIADHLIARAGALLSPNESARLSEVVLAHVGLLIGDAVRQIEEYDFLTQDVDPDPFNEARREMFCLLLWLIDHPQWIRSDRAAVAMEWVLRGDGGNAFDAWAVPAAFGMEVGYAPDVLCGVYDALSRLDPLTAWERIEAQLDIAVAVQCRHVSRIAVLRDITERARDAGSATAARAAERIVSLFRTGAILLPPLNESADNLPAWANCVRDEWRALKQNDVITAEMKKRLVEEMERMCAPLSIEDACELDKAVSVSFRMLSDFPLNRWEAKVRFSLNVALFPFVSIRELTAIASELRVYNPAVPDATITPDFRSPLSTVLFNDILAGNFAGVIGDADNFFLHYAEVSKEREAGRRVQLHVMAVLLPRYSADVDSALPDEAFFPATQIPNREAALGPLVTCFSVQPVRAFFGSFTPGYPAPSFAERIGAGPDDFLRVNWRAGRSPEDGGYPNKEGCLLAVKRSAVHLPEGTKLAWLVRVDGELVELVDERGIPL